ncbi:MAG: cyclodeaminase/cyclohydrolase family protein [Bacillota bacterium]|jgi:formiminotetrahydrofolate cyclodeaminase
MSDLFGKSLKDVLKASASSEPVPGGGSVSAIVGAFAASMAAMVANLTIGKKKYRKVESQMVSLRDKALSLMSRSEELVDADMGHFKKFIEYYKMPASTPEEEERKDHLIQEALKDATETPLEIAQACLQVLETVVEMAPIGSKMAISDAGVAAYLADAALKAALLNVDINLPQIKDHEFAEKARGRKDALIEKSNSLLAESVSIVASRLGS